MQLYFGLVRKISRRLDSQSKLQMFIYTNFWPSLEGFELNISTNISTLGQRTHLKVG